MAPPSEVGAPTWTPEELRDRIAAVFGDTVSVPDADKRMAADAMDTPGGALSAATSEASDTPPGEATGDGHAGLRDDDVDDPEGGRS